MEICALPIAIFLLVALTANMLASREQSTAVIPLPARVQTIIWACVLAAALAFVAFLFIYNRG